MININKIRLSGTTYNIQDLNATKTVELTQAEYDALPVKDPNVFYIITDAQGADLSNYYTKSETSGATEISTALESKSDTATTYTKTETDNAITAATYTKQDTLVSGTNIKTINNQSILGEGNITIEGGGGTSYEAGRAIDITSNRISLDLPISAGTGTNALIYNSTINAASGDYAHAEGEYTTANGISSHAEGYNATASGDGSHAEGSLTTASGSFSHAEGHNTTANGISSHAEGYNATASGEGSHAEGNSTIAKNKSEHASGQFNVSSSASTTFGHAGNTLFSVGNGTSNSGRKNAFEIRQNGDTYLNGKLSITSDVTANAFYATSDERLKENIENVSYAKMANAANVNIKSFNFKSDEEKKTVIGVIAQDVEKENLGFIVSTSNDGMKAVDYTGLSLLKIAYLEQKVKELENTINELKQNKQ